MNRSPRLDKHRLRAIEDALLFRRASPRDLNSVEEGDYADALAWTQHQLGKRRERPTQPAPLSTPLEQWLDRHPEEPGR